MKKVLCTLFGFSYLDKGLVLYESLERVAGDFVLYALAMDDECHAYLQACGYDSMVPIRLSDFENDALREAKGNRSFGEYCWTCSAALIAYVLDRYGEPCCAYIDADMAFYADPGVLFDELERRGGSVLLTGHRFCRFEKEREASAGRFCVEFNLFRNDEAARGVLRHWVEQCLESCSADMDGGSFGDQRYLDDWVDTYGFVLETAHPGAGVAPWNLPQYRLVSHDPVSGGYRLRVGGRETELVFFHFAGLKYVNRNLADISVYYYWGIDGRFVVPLYSDYLQALERYKRQVQEKTGKEILLTSHPAFTKDRPSAGGRVRSLFRRLCAPNGLKHFFWVEVPQKLQRRRNLFRITD